jgi:hypothetical protein
MNFQYIYKEMHLQNTIHNKFNLLKHTGHVMHQQV